MNSSSDEDNVAEEAALLIALAEEMRQTCTKVTSPAGLRIRPSIGLASSRGACAPPWRINATSVLPTQNNKPSPNPQHVRFELAPHSVGTADVLRRGSSGWVQALARSSARLDGPSACMGRQ
jgi:hypothetical protein